MTGVGEQRRIDRIDAVTRAALTLFERQGYDPTLVEEVAALAGTSRRSVFRHFGGKDDLLRGIHDHWLVVFADHLALDRPSSLHHRAFEAPAMAVVDDTLADPDPVLRAHRLVEQVPALRTAWGRYEHDWRDVISEILERDHGIESHEARIEAAAIATNLLAAIAAWSRRPDRTDLRALVGRGFAYLDERAAPP